MDPNNFDFAMLNRRAIDLVELVMQQEPYASLPADAQASTRTALLPQYLKLVLDESKATQQPTPQPPTPSYDPNVASAIYETTDCLRNMTVRTADNEATLDSIARRGLSLRQAKDLQSMIQPLSREGRKPPRQDLSTFWSKVKRAISGIGPSIEARAMSNRHIHLIAPIILGDHIYTSFENLYFGSWSEFEQAVEKKYGLSNKQILDAFYAMKPQGDESESEFLLRVEDFRIKYNQSEDTCFRTFIPQLSLEYRRELKALSRSQQQSDLTWDQVIMDANRCCDYSSLTPEDGMQKLVGFQKQQMETPDEHVVSAVPVHNHSASKGRRSPSTTSNHLSFNTQDQETQSPKPQQQPEVPQRKPWQNRWCSLCALVGRTNASSHNLADCYANPKSDKCRPMLCKLRLSDIKKKGLAIPDCMKDIADDPNWQMGPKQQEEAQQKQEDSTPKLDKALLNQLDSDFQLLLQHNPGNIAAAFQEACMANLGFLIEDRPEEQGPNFMFKDFSEDINAASNDYNPHYETIKQHLNALQKFSDEDLQGAQNEMEVDQSVAGGVHASDSDSSDSDDDGAQQDKYEEDQQSDSNYIDSSTVYRKGLRLYRASGAQTGGVYGAGVRVGQKIRQKQEPSLGSQVAKMRILLPLFQGIQIKPNMRKLILTKTLLEAHKQGDTVQVVEGTRIKEVSRQQMEEESQVYSDAGVDEEVQRRLKAIKNKYKKGNTDQGGSRSRKRDSHSMLNEILDKVSVLLDTAPGVQQATEEVDRALLFAGSEKIENKLPAGARGMPHWASEDAENLRGLITVHQTHYIGMVQINNKIIEVMLDSGGSRTMTDRDTAIALGLNIQWADDKRNFGTYSGVSGTPNSYLGRAVGPIELKFSGEVFFQLDEMKIFNYPEAIIIIGTDLLGHASRGDHTFAYLGVNPVTTAGEIIFYTKKNNKVVVCELVSAPTSHTNLHVLPNANKKKTSFEDDSANL